MASSSLAMQGMFARLNWRQMAGPVLIILILAMMVLPLPPLGLRLGLGLAAEIIQRHGRQGMHPDVLLTGSIHGAIVEQFIQAVAEFLGQGQKLPITQGYEPAF